MDLVWYHWAVLGLVLIMTELVVPAFVLVWFGLGALIVTLALLIDPGLSFVGQLLLWAVMSIAMVLLWFRIFKPYRHKTLSGQSSAEVVGEIGLLVDAVQPFQNGKVRFQKPLLGTDIWDCSADQPISAGARVRVVSVDGNILKITMQ